MQGSLPASERNKFKGFEGLPGCEFGVGVCKVKALRLVGLRVYSVYKVYVLGFRGLGSTWNTQEP